jgi:hypothetical protein
MDASALRKGRVDLLPARRDGNNTQDKSTQQFADSHGQRCCLIKADAAAGLKGSGSPISLQFFDENLTGAFARKPRFALISKCFSQSMGQTAVHNHHQDGRRRLMLASLRYLDTFVKINGAWLFAEHLLYVDWLEERTLS